MSGRLRATWIAIVGVKAAVAAAIFGLWLAWRGGLAAAGVASEIAAIEPERLAAAATWSADERIRDALGPDDEIFRAVREHVPLDGRVVFHRVAKQDEYLFFQLRTLLYPRRIVPPPPELTPQWRPPAGSLSAGVFLLDLAPDAPLAARLDFEPVAGGEGWALSRAKLPR